MFNDNERNELVGRILLMLEQEKAGKAVARQELAEKLVDEAREYLKGRYNASTGKNPGGFGVHKGTDIIRKEDYPSV